MARRLIFSIAVTAVLSALSISCPAEMLYSTFVGGSDREIVASITTDASGNILIAGTTWSMDFPTTPGVIQEEYTGVTDGFIIVMTPELDQLLASTLIGGSYSDEGRLIHIDPSGDLLLIGRTMSADFPVTPGAWGQAPFGENDIVMIRMTPQLDQLLVSSYFGGSEDDWACASVLHSSGNLWITGSTRSEDFPVTPGCFDPDYNSGSDIFVTRLSPADGSPVVSTYIGAPGAYKSEYASGLAINSHGDVVVCGNAVEGFPTTAGAYDTSFNGWRDYVVFRMKENLAKMGACTYLGGWGTESTNPRMTLDQSDNVIITGYTNSDDYPVTSGAWDTVFNDLSESVLSVLSPRLDTLVASTYCDPGDVSLSLGSLRVTESGGIIAGGRAMGPLQWDALVLSTTPSLNRITALTVFGGAEHDSVSALTVDGSGGLVLTGTTDSMDFPTTPGAFDTSFSGTPGSSSHEEDVYIARRQLQGYDTFFTGMDCQPRTIELPQTAWVKVSISNTTYGTRHVDSRLGARLPDGTTVENMRFAHTTLAAGGSYRRTWIHHFPLLPRLDGVTTFILRSVDVTPAPWNQPPYPPSGHMDTSELPIRIIVP